MSGAGWAGTAHTTMKVGTASHSTAEASPHHLHAGPDHALRRRGRGVRRAALPRHPHRGRGHEHVLRADAAGVQGAGPRQDRPHGAGGGQLPVRPRPLRQPGQWSVPAMIGNAWDREYIICGRCLKL